MMSRSGKEGTRASSSQSGGEDEQLGDQGREEEGKPICHSEPVAIKIVQQHKTEQNLYGNAEEEGEYD